MARKGLSVRVLAKQCGLAGHGMVQQLRSGRRSGCSEMLAVALASKLELDLGELFVVPASSNALRNTGHHTRNGG
jgi:hypothetical protein